MAIELVPPTAEHVPQLGRIFFEAFKGIAAAHHFPFDVPSVEAATGLMAMLAARPDFYGVVAVETDGCGGGRADGSTVVGFNFLQKSDEVGGVGPLCVAPGFQQAGVGRRLMQDVIEHALRHHGPMVRLLQEAYNMASLSLYTAMGYDVKEPVVLMSVPPAETPDETVRPLTLADMDAAERLCREIYRVSRRNELAAIVAHGRDIGCVPQGRFVAGELRAYVVPGFFGHAVAHRVDDLLMTLRQGARVSPPEMHRVLVPMRTELFRSGLKEGFRSIKPLTTMAMGPYESPRGAWAPSIGF